MPSRKKKRPDGGEWQPDLFGGRGIERREGLSRAEQLALARDEMRQTASRDLFDALADQEQRSNPWRKVALTTDKRGRPVAYIRTSNQPGRYIRIGYDEAKLELATGRATQEAFRPIAPRRNPPPRGGDRRLELAYFQGRRARNVGRPLSGCPYVRGSAIARAWADGWREAAQTNPADTPEMRYRRAVGHGERVATARKAAANPGRAVGRMAPNCPMCGALVRLRNPVPSVVTCGNCGQQCQVRRP